MLAVLQVNSAQHLHRALALLWPASQRPALLMPSRACMQVSGWCSDGKQPRSHRCAGSDAAVARPAHRLPCAPLPYAAAALSSLAATKDQEHLSTILAYAARDGAGLRCACLHALNLACSAESVQPSQSCSTNTQCSSAAGVAGQWGSAASAQGEVDEQLPGHGQRAHRERLRD